jgi:2,4-dienoyl-CoA reductase (NADPH2)
MAFRLFLPDLPEKAISEGTIDFWEACRPMIADPQLPAKIAEGRTEEIVPCIACNLCFSRLYYHQPIMCTVRPSLGHERDDAWGYYGFVPAKQRKRVGVIGGGPAGLQFAAVAAQRGHDVVLWEKGGVLGGSLLLASKVDQGDEELLRPAHYLEKECRKAGVELRLETECTTEMLKNHELDIAVFAGGSSFKSMAPLHCLSPYDIIALGKEPGRRVIIVGGEGVGLALAVYLLNKGDYELTIIEESWKLGRDVSPFYLWRYVRLLKERQATVLTRASLSGGGGNCFFVTSAKGNRTIEADNLVMTLRQGREDLMRTLEPAAPELFLIGDAKRPRRLHNAIRDAYSLGMRI